LKGVEGLSANGDMGGGGNARININKLIDPKLNLAECAKYSV